MCLLSLAISCLTTSILPWFMDLTFQVPMQYCSLQHWTLLPSPVTSTTGYCFCFGSVSSFFMELFLYSSPVAYWVPTNLGVHLSVSYIFAFSYCSWGSQGKNTEMVCKWITTNCGKFWERWEYQTTWPASWEMCMQVKKQCWKLDMEQQTGSK